MSAEIQKTVEDLGRAWEQFKANNEDQTKATARGVSASIFEEKAVKLNERISELQASLDAIAAKAARPSENGDTARNSEASKAFLNWMRKGEARMSADEVKAMSVGSNDNGGYLVPVDASGRGDEGLRDVEHPRDRAGGYDHLRCRRRAERQR